MAAYNKIFFQSGPTGNVPGWGQFVEEANRQGIPVGAAVSDTTSLLDDLKTHGRKFGVANRGNFIPTGYITAEQMKKIDPNWQGAWGSYHLSIPLYNLFPNRDEAEQTYQRAAKMHLDAVETRIPVGLDREMVSVSTWNEIRPYKGWGSMSAPDTPDWQEKTPGYTGWADAIGRQAYWIGKELVRRKEAGEKWFRWAAFGFAGGNPEPGVWEAAGMLDYLRLAGQHPEVLGLALHEYCFTFDIWRGFEQKNFIGRFEQLFAVCDEQQIPRPWVEIKEWGWKEDDIPDKGEAMKQLGEVAAYYARFPQIKLAALWTANGGWRDASKKVPGLAQEIYKFTLATRFPDPEPGPIVTPPVDKPPKETGGKTDDGAKPAVQLLQNGGFEADWGVEKSHQALQIDAAGLHEIAVGNVFTPPHWLVYFYHKEGELAQPEVRDARHKERTFAGEKGQVFFTFNRRHHGGFLQTVRTVPGQRLTLTAVAHAWSNHKDEAHPDRFPHPDDPKWSDGVGYGGHFILKGDTKPTDDDAVRNFTFRVGIDPTGGRDPRSDKVVWGTEAHIYNAYHAVPSVSAQAVGDKATVFLESQTLWPLKHNDAYWDEAQLWQGAPQTGGTTKPPANNGDDKVVTGKKVVLRQVLTAVSDPINTLQIIVKKRDGSGWKTERTITLPFDPDTQIELQYIEQVTETKPPTDTGQNRDLGDDKQEKGSGLGDLREADTRKRLLGMDVSDSQSPKAIRYDKLKEEGIAYAFLRASRGSSVAGNGFWVADGSYNAHFAELGKVGILRGSYHVLYEWDPEGQAQKFFNIYKPGELPPVLDIEKGQYTGKLTAVVAQRFLKKWAELGGEPPIIYTNQSTWNELIGNPKWSTDYKLWVASYDADGDNPYAMPKPWGKEDWSFWQYTRTGRLQAYDKGNSNIDLNWFKGGLTSLRSLSSATHKDKIGQGDEEKPKDKGKVIDLLEYMRGDGRIYEVQHPDGRTETFQTQTDGQKFFFVKNQQWEELWADDQYIWRGKDTSPGPAPDYAERPGKLRYYHQFEPGKEGARWAKRYMAVGETFTGSGHRVQFYYKDNGAKSAANSGNPTNKVTLVAFHESKTWGNNTIRGVIELKTSTGETMFFGKGWGLVAWGSDWGQSAVLEQLHGRTPNKREIIR
ncbi:MAG: hypothetical protein KDE56_02735 [Anaerolineales bacterium]|nr:hypothetical protein [Anaerolineales bacterium]